MIFYSILLSHGSIHLSLIVNFFDCILYIYTVLFLYRFRDGDTIDVLADALDDLRKTLQGVRAISFTGDSRDVIIYAANLLGPSKFNNS